MIFLNGSTLLGADELELSYTPTNVNRITKVKMWHAWFNDLFVWTQEGDEDGVMPEPSVVIPDEWDFNTVMRAHYEDSTMAGNVDWDIAEMDYLLVKRKKLSTGDWKEDESNKWITLKVMKIEDGQDRFDIYEGIDKTVGNGTYVYALVPIFHGNVEGAYVEADPITVTIDRLVIVDKDEVWSTIFVDGGVSIQHVMPSQAVETMYDKYPTVISNTDANYRTVTVDAKWLPYDGCDPSLMDDDEVRVSYNDRLINFLHNKEIKLLKAVNGRLFLIWITTPASISTEESDILENVSFGGTEIGSVYDEELLYKAGFTDVTSEWWYK